MLHTQSGHVIVNWENTYIWNYILYTSTFLLMIGRYKEEGDSYTVLKFWLFIKTTSKLYHFEILTQE